MEGPLQSKILGEGFGLAMNWEFEQNFPKSQQGKEVPADSWVMVGSEPKQRESPGPHSWSRGK